MPGGQALNHPKDPTPHLIPVLTNLWLRIPSWRREGLRTNLWLVPTGLVGLVVVLFAVP